MRCARLVPLAVATSVVACHEFPAHEARAQVALNSISALAAAATSPLPMYTALADTRGVERCDLAIGVGGVQQAIVDAGLDPALADALDAAFVARVDLFALATPGRMLTLWTRGGALVAARLTLAQGVDVFAAHYGGRLAPHGFYDADGRAMSGALLARPVALPRITSRFGERFDAFTGEPGSHRGVDYGVPVGTAVVAVGDGVVKAIGASRASGNFIKLAHVSGYESLYLHLDAVEHGLHVGDVVAQAQLIGRSGDTGRSTGPHLHYELHLAGIPIDPLATLPMPKVVLGPIARREHLAFLRQLEATHDRRRYQ